MESRQRAIPLTSAAQEGNYTEAVTSAKISDIAGKAIGITTAGCLFCFFIFRWALDCFYQKVSKYYENAQLI